MADGQLSWSQIQRLKKRLKHPPIIEHRTYLVHPTLWHLVVEDYPEAEGLTVYRTNDVTFVCDGDITNA